MKNKKHHIDLVTVLLVGVLVAGLGIFFYPAFSNWYNQFHQSQVIVEYSETVNKNDKKKNEEMWQQALAYNNRLSQITVPTALSESGEKEYKSLLNVTDTGVMGYIQIDKVDIRLPIYHDTTESVLQIAVGHMAGTSLPVGGKSTHCLLTGHTGLPSARLFTDIDQLKKGDIFQIHVLDHTLTYQVERIQTVLPKEVSQLKIEEGRDLCTLMTCTPYGINTHRLLVTGHRIPNPKHKETSQNKNKKMMMIISAFIVIILIIILVLLLKKKYKKGKGEKHSS